MTDATEKHAAERSPTKKHGLTAEQIAGLSVEEKQELIAELEAAIEELRRPVPQPYPKWVEIDGVSMVVQSPEEEAAKKKATAEFHVAEAKDAKAAEHKDAHEGDDTRRRR